jgi:hypothetical protein
MQPLCRSYTNAVQYRLDESRYRFVIGELSGARRARATHAALYIFGCLAKHQRRGYHQLLNR